MREAEIWRDFRERTFPRRVAGIRRSLGPEALVTVDWVSLGDGPRLAESFDYDLEMLARGLEGVDSWDPFGKAPDKPDPARIREGIAKVHIRRVHQPDDVRLHLVGQTLNVDFWWEGTGAFSARDVECLLVDRAGERVSGALRSEIGTPPPRLEEVRRNRLPAVLQLLGRAMREPVHLHFDWTALDDAPDAPVRLVRMLRELASALETLCRKDPGVVVGPEFVHERAKTRAGARSAAVRESIHAIHVRGALLGEEDVCRLSGGTLQLAVFQDAEYVAPPREDGYTVKPLTMFRKFPGCSSNDIQAILEEDLDLETGPLLRQVRESDVPKAQAHLPERIDGLIAKSSHLGMRERHALRRILTERGVALTVDWESFLGPEQMEDRVAALRSMETGQYNYNCDFGDLFQPFMHALDEAFRTSSSFASTFVPRVRTVRYELVRDPGQTELAVRGSALVLRECPHMSGGRTRDYTDLATMLVSAVRGMPDDPVDATRPRGVESRIDALAEVLGEGIRVQVDPALLAAAPELVESFASRVLAQVEGAFRILLDRGGYAKSLRRILSEVCFVPGPAADEPGFTFRDGTLTLPCRPEDGPSGFPAGEDLLRGIDAALALRVRTEIEEIERQEHEFWERMLRERFDREVPVEIDWDGFLAHPEHGGDRLYTLEVKEAGVMRLVYALTGGMDEDEKFRKRAREVVEGVLVTCAPGVDDKTVIRDGPILVYRCLPDPGYKGFLTIDEIQMRLLDLIA